MRKKSIYSSFHHQLPILKMQTKELFRNAVSNYENGINDQDTLNILESIRMRLSTTTTFGNENYDEYSLNRLRYLVVFYLLPELIYRSSIIDVNIRRLNLNKCVELYTQFGDHLDSIGLESDTIPRNQSADSSTQRDLKIQQFKHQKHLESQLLEYKELLSDDSSEGLFKTMFNSSTSNHTSSEQDDNDDEDDEDDDVLREYLIRLLKYLASLSLSQIHSIEMELDLLNNIPENINDTRTRATSATSDSTWRIDNASTNTNNLIDKNGRPTRPFTIMPRGTQTTRQQIAAGVFQPSHRLPTMTIDEYLQDEADRGNIIEGGG